MSFSVFSPTLFLLLPILAGLPYQEVSQLSGPKRGSFPSGAAWAYTPEESHCAGALSRVAPTAPGSQGRGCCPRSGSSRVVRLVSGTGERSLRPPVTPPPLGHPTLRPPLDACPSPSSVSVYIPRFCGAFLRKPRQPSVSLTSYSMYSVRLTA